MQHINSFGNDRQIYAPILLDTTDKQRHSVVDKLKVMMFKTVYCHLLMYFIIFKNQDFTCIGPSSTSLLLYIYTCTCIRIVQLHVCL